MKNQESTFPFVQDKKTRMEIKAEDYGLTADKTLLMIEKSLLNGGVQKFVYDEKLRIIQFPVACFENYGVTTCRYEIEVMPGIGQIEIRNMVVYDGISTGIHNLDWYLEKQNKYLQSKRDGNVQYALSRVKGSQVIVLYSHLRIKGIQERQIVQRISKMNRILAKDYSEIENICQGNIKDEIKEEIRREYLLYQGEWTGHERTDESSAKTGNRT